MLRCSCYIAGNDQRQSPPELQQFPDFHFLLSGSSEIKAFTMYTEIEQKAGTFRHSFTKASHSWPYPYQSGLSFIVSSNLWDSAKKADRLLTYRLFVCLSSAFDSLYYSINPLTMQCVFSPIKRLLSIYKNVTMRAYIRLFSKKDCTAASAVCRAEGIEYKPLYLLFSLLPVLHGQINRAANGIPSVGFPYSETAYLR